MKTENNQFIYLPVPLNDLADSGIDLGGVIQTSVIDGKLVIENADISDFVCDEDCENCPVNETECNGDCFDCPCSELCDESEAE